MKHLLTVLALLLAAPLLCLGQATIADHNLAGKLTAPTSASTGDIIVRSNSSWVALPLISGGLSGSTGSTDNRLLRADGTGGSTVQNSAVLVDDYTSSTANNVAIKVDDGSTANISAVITPKGSGAFILGAKPDGTSTGGNARGAYAVDLQTAHFTAAAVASGANAVAGGFGNTASGTSSIAMGQQNTASGYVGAVALGYLTTASGSYGATATGNITTASGESSFATGSTTVADKKGQMATSGGSFAANGDSQTSIITLRNSTASTTPTVLFTDGSSARLTIPNNTFITFTILLSGTTATGTSERYSYKLEGCIGKGTTSGSTAMPAAVTKTVIFEANASADVDATADTTNGALSVTVTAANSTATRWSASVTWNQVAYP